MKEKKTCICIISAMQELKNEQKKVLKKFSKEQYIFSNLIKSNSYLYLCTNEKKLLV